ncbi:MAG: glycosyltransferase, partial [Ornithinimicrobium sp.]
MRSDMRSMMREVIERTPMAPVTRLPSQGGRAGRTAVLIRAAHLRLASRPHEALRLLDRMPTADLPARGHTLRAQALEDTGQLDQALAAARAATTASPSDVSALLTRLRIARAVAADTDVTVCLELACQVEPRNAVEAAQLARAFRSDDIEVLRAFVERMPHWKHTVSTAEQVRVETEGLVACGVSDRDISETAVRAASDSQRALERAVLQVVTLSDWRAAARLVGEVSVSREIAKEVSRAAARALKDGWVDEAAVIADCAIRSGTGMNQARAVHAQAMEQQFVIRSGWPVELPRERRYEPDRRSTLTVLAQSLPHRSGGYATRSHGILTGLRARGWEPQVVTRLGFPYDRWSSSNTDEVSDKDVVDGVAYTRLLEPGERAYPTTPIASYIERFTARIMAHATQQRAALIHASSFQNNGLAGLAAARRLGIPFVYEMRGLEDLMKVSRKP